MSQLSAISRSLMKKCSPTSGWSVSSRKLSEDRDVPAKLVHPCLKQLAEFQGEIKHVLLFFHFLEAPTARHVDPLEFTFLSFRAITVPESMYPDISIPERAMARAEDGQAEPGTAHDRRGM